PFHFSGPPVILRAREVTGIQRTEDRLLDARPCAAGFDTNEPAVAHLPIVADVTTDEPAIHGVVTNVGSAVVETNVSKTPAAVEASIKTGPRIDRHRDRRRHDGHIGSDTR